MWAWPSIYPAALRAESVSDAAVGALRRTWAALRYDPGGAGCAPVSPAAWVVVAEWFEQNRTAQAAARRLRLAYLVKLPRQVLRLALVLHALENPGAIAQYVTDVTMRQAIRLADYFTAHAFLVLRVFEQRAAMGHPVAERVLEALRQLGGTADLSTLHRKLGGHLRREDLWAAIDLLAQKGLIELAAGDGAGPGRPRQVVRLTGAAAGLDL